MKAWKYHILYMTMIGLSAGGPYIVSNWPNLLRNAAQRWTPSEKTAGSSQFAPHPQAEGKASTSAPLNVLARQSVELEHSKAIPIETALDFHITPDWILNTWPRVTTKLSRLEMQGLRVPYISGTTESDIAGSLTYYFDQESKLQRITFSGTTGDTTRLVHQMARRFGFQKQITTDPSLILYQVLWDGKPRGQLWIEPKSVSVATAQQGRFKVILGVDRPSGFSPFGRTASSAHPYRDAL